MPQEAPSSVNRTTSPMPSTCAPSVGGGIARVPVYLAEGLALLGLEEPGGGGVHHEDAAIRFWIALGRSSALSRVS